MFFLEKVGRFLYLTGKDFPFPYSEKPETDVIRAFFRQQEPSEKRGLREYGENFLRLFSQYALFSCPEGPSGGDGFFSKLTGFLKYGGVGGYFSRLQIGRAHV